MSTWHAAIGYTITPALTEETAFDLLDALAENGAAMSVSRDLSEAHVTMTITADNATAAAETARQVLANAVTDLGTITITELRVLTPEAMDRENREPIFPPVLGFAEIAEHAGVSRQRARQFTKIGDFPEPVIVTAQGPLFNAHAIEQWISTRDTKPGRRKASVPST